MSRFLKNPCTSLCEHATEMRGDETPRLPIQRAKDVQSAGSQ